MSYTRIGNYDSAGDPLIKTKVTKVGWTYDQRAVILTTSLLASLNNKKNDNTEWGDATVKFYDASDVELTVQATMDTDCVKTVMDWEPIYDYDLIGGETDTLSVPNGYDKTACLWCLAIPDLTPAQGGSVNMIDGRALKEDNILVADGRAVTTLNYNATYHTNKMRTIIRHLAGDQIRLEVVFETYYQRS